MPTNISTGAHELAQHLLLVYPRFPVSAKATPTFYFSGTFFDSALVFTLCGQNLPIPCVDSLMSVFLVSMALYVSHLQAYKKSLPLGPTELFFFFPATTRRLDLVSLKFPLWLLNAFKTQKHYPLSIILWLAQLVPVTHTPP